MEIYRLVLPWARPIISPVSPMIYLRDDSPDATIFQISKAINREAMDVFYSDNVFSISPAMFTKPLDITRYLAYPGASFIQNVVFVTEYGSKHKGPVCRETIRDFGGLEIPRNTFRFVFFIDGWSHFDNLNPIFFQDLATMTGF